MRTENRMEAEEIELLDRENALLELERIVARVRDHGRHELHYGTSPAANPPAAKPSLVDRLRVRLAQLTWRSRHAER